MSDQRARTSETPANDPPGDTKRDAGRNDDEAEAEADEVSVRGQDESVHSSIEIAHEQGTGGACPLDLVEDGRAGSTHRLRVSRDLPLVDGGSDRDPSESSPLDRIRCPTRVGWEQREDRARADDRPR